VQVSDKLIELKEKILEKPPLNVRRKIKAATTLMPASSFKDIDASANENNKIQS